MEEKTRLTTAAGAPVVDNQNVQTAGPRGPMLLQDVWFLEKLAHFDREVIPERRMHAKGSAAYDRWSITRTCRPPVRVARCCCRTCGSSRSSPTSIAK